MWVAVLFLKRLATKSAKTSLIFAELLGRCRIDWADFECWILDFAIFSQFGLYKTHANPWVGGCSHGCPLVGFSIAGWVPEVVFCGDEATNKKQHWCCFLIRIWKNGGPKLRKKKKKNNAMGLDLLMFLNLILNTIYLYTAIGVKICLIFYLMFDIQCTVYKYAIYLIFFTSHMYKHNSFDSNKNICSYRLFIRSNHSYPISPAPFLHHRPFFSGPLCRLAVVYKML